MADPKYADLPGIDYDQPDVYETKDLPEADQSANFYEEEADNVERLNITPNEAYDKFKGKHIRGETVDFSDKLRKRKNTGYDIKSGDWELMAEHEKETPLQKYDRLKCEMQELVEEVNAMQAKPVEPRSAEMPAQINEALKQLFSLHLEDKLGTDQLDDYTDPHGNQFKKLQSQLDQFRQQKEAKGDKSKRPSASSSAGCVTYQLKYSPVQSQFKNTSRLAELESRLNSLESVLGVTSERLSRIANASYENGIFGTVQELSAKTSLLNSAQLDHIEGRLTAMVQKMNQISEQKSANTAEAAPATGAESQPDENKERAISEIYDFVKSIENISQILPNTVERLEALESLHAKAAEFSKGLVELKQMQTQIAHNLQNDKALLQGVQESFAANLDSIHKNLNALDQRIKAIKK